MSRKETIAETPVRLFAVASLLVAVWILTYWLYEPGEPRVTFATDTDGSEIAPRARTEERGAGIEEAAWDSPVGQPDTLELAEDPALSPDPIADDPGWRAEPPDFREIVVKRGETLQSIAKREYGSVRYAQAIMSANPFVDPNRLKAGRTKLRLPLDPKNVSGRDVAPAEEGSGAEAPPVEPPPTPAYREHLVTKRDTLWGISKLYYGKGHLWRRIHDANRDVITNPDRPPVGRTLRIPMDDG